ncbi:hypothetical protein FB45DRAFT_1103153 [Roridomyces roridus]|uniref:Uncharacterized protein n=1 Tax=Roridomyces roridus TaxID=1738132 RepID=A0AAD7BDW4_9AGAR|nr:hypothetical protein FB45DRAFT_1103153 [Roridomyces roridus]
MDGPPKYTELHKWEAALPQYNLSLPFPEGRTGKYVEFSNQVRLLGWNNVFNDVLMCAHLAYLSGRAYVFQDYYWSPDHYHWPAAKYVDYYARTPLPAIVSGPVAGGSFEHDDPAPRSVSSDYFDLVCPRSERRFLNTREVKPAVSDAEGIDVLSRWQTVLSEAPERCIEIVSAEEDGFPQVFDLGLWGSTRVLSLWDSFAASPISRLLRPSPIVSGAIERNARALSLGYLNAAFYSWNLFPWLPDRYATDDMPGREEKMFERCYPTRERVVEKLAEVRREYLTHAGNATLDTVYILTNEKGGWIEELREGPKEDGWMLVVSSQQLELDAEQLDVSMAVDMEIARRAAVFVGNGWSSFTSNIVYERLLDKRDPITIRYT